MLNLSTKINKTIYYSSITIYYNSLPSNYFIMKLNSYIREYKHIKFIDISIILYNSLKNEYCKDFDQNVKNCDFALQNAQNARIMETVPDRNTKKEKGLTS